MSKNNSLFLLETRYNSKLNKIESVYYDEEEENLFIFADTSNFKPYCLTTLTPDEFYAHCITKQYHSLIRNSQFSGARYLRLLPVSVVQKFDTIYNKNRQFTKITGNNPLDIGARTGKGVAISKYLNDDELAWENTVKYQYSYIFDKQIVCGMPYVMKKDFIDVTESIVCPKCGKTNGYYEYYTKITFELDDDNIPIDCGQNGLINTKVSCANSDCNFVFEKHSFDKKEYKYLVTVKKSFGYKTVSKKRITPIREEFEIDKNIVSEFESAFLDEHPQEQAYVKNLIPFFFYRIPFIKRQGMDIEVLVDNFEIGIFPDAERAKYPINCVCFVGSDGKKLSLLLKTYKKNGKLQDKIPKDMIVEVFPFNNEGELSLINRIFEQLLEYPCFITFNGDNFDLLYIHNRALRLGMKKDNIPYWIRSYVIQGQTKNQAIMKNDTIHLDLYPFFSNPSLKTYAFNGAYRENSLDVISFALLKRRKVHHEILNEENVQKSIVDYTKTDLLYYCYNDTLLTLDLTLYDEEIVMKITFLLMRLSKTGITDVFSHKISFWIKNMIHYFHREQNYVIPQQNFIRRMTTSSTQSVIKGKKYEGAIVIEPVPGIHFDVVVLDFASLYPSAIKVENLSYETVSNKYGCDHDECLINVIPTTRQWVCKKRVGILALILGSIKDIRVKHFKSWKKIFGNPDSEFYNKALSQYYGIVESVLKVYINGSYGVFGSNVFYYFQIAVAECTTAIGRYCIITIMDKAEHEMGLVISGGDTDSVFLVNPSKKNLQDLMDFSQSEFNISLGIDYDWKFQVVSNRKKNYIGFFRQKKRYSDGWDDPNWKRPAMKGVTGKKKNTPAFITVEFSKVIRYLDENIYSKDDLKPAIKHIVKMVRQLVYKLEHREFKIKDLAIVQKITKDPIHGYKGSSQHINCARLEMGISVDKKTKNISKNTTLTSFFGNKPKSVQTKKYEAGDFIAYVKTKGKYTAMSLSMVTSWSQVNIQKYKDILSTVFAQLFDCFGISMDKVINSTSSL